MDDLKKLLENAGITEMDVLNRDISDTLGELSGGQFEFQVHDYGGPLEVFTQQSDGMRMIARFDNFNAMIEAAIGN